MIPQALTSAYLPQKRTMSISVENPDPDSGQAPKSSGAKLGNGIATLPLDRYPTEIQMYTNNKIYAHNHFLSK
jgi:hypothetical protein